MAESSPSSGEDIAEGFSFLVDRAELLKLAVVAVEGLPAGYRGYRQRADIILVPWVSDWGIMVMRLRGPKMSKRLALALEGRCGDVV